MGKKVKTKKMAKNDTKCKKNKNWNNPYKIGTLCNILSKFGKYWNLISMCNDLKKDKYLKTYSFKKCPKNSIMVHKK